MKETEDAIYRLVHASRSHGISNEALEETLKLKVGAVTDAVWELVSRKPHVVDGFKQSFLNFDGVKRRWYHVDYDPRTNNV